ncbi:aminotransferase class V-fold PLP-dependent enzyme [Agaribacterium haliotis]|uniref:aminotransferase class V-fold PLP-dependent enzyme n=1 Tax=Agaribacterium haliotis TaxID=2013869 RepID=UPI000BB55058|nr:aminotransferase class V-fold PLP-dependent enzyme [Agaribacterium haliotis]
MSLKQPIYFDYAATTPVDPAVAKSMSACLTLDGNFANPASRSHLFGWKAEEAVEHARAELAGLINADPREIVWTSGATEASNLALKGLVEKKALQGAHIITSSIEHKSVLDVCAELEALGCEVSYVSPECDGRVSIDTIKAAQRENTALVSLMHANNETGALNDIAELGAWTREQGIFLHVDAAQSVAKIDVDVKALNIDLMSISAHKMYGPKGQGALYVRRCPELELSAQMHGGGHERGMRSGTLATHQIVGMGKAAELARARLPSEKQRLQGLREELFEGLEGCEGISHNGSFEHSVPGIVNLCFKGVEGEVLLLSLRELAVSSGSACMSATMAPSYVLAAMGLSEADALSSIRLSFGRFTRLDDIKQAVAVLRRVYSSLAA